MATGDYSDYASMMSNTTTTVSAGLFVAVGLGAVYAYYAQLGRPPSGDQDAASDERARASEVKRAGAADANMEELGRTSRRGRKRKKGKGRDEGVGEAAVPVVPGGFDGAGEGHAKVEVIGSSDVSPVGVASKPGHRGGKPKKTKNRTKSKTQRKQDKTRDEVEAEVDGVDSETGLEEVGDGLRIAAHEARSFSRTGGDDSANASFSASVGASTALATSARAMGKGSLRASTRLASPSQPQAQARVHGPTQPRKIQIRPSPSLDTDSSWTHVDRHGGDHRRHHPKTSESTDGQASSLADAVEATSSDLASTTSESPVVERTDGSAADTHGTRAHLVQHTLAERLVPKPRKTEVDDMLEQPDFPTLARVMRIQPPADETPVPGFSWDDYGDVIEDSLVVHDADQEDEGEWGIVKSRNRTRPPETTITASTSASSLALTQPATMTKKQRQNARKRELVKSTKAEAEAVRLEGLVKHKNELERLRIIEQSRQGGGKRPSGGMNAAVDERGKLVWE